MTVGEQSPLVLDLGAAASLVAHRWKRVVFGVALGLLTAAAILLFVRPSFTGRALLLIRQFPEAGAQVQSKLSQISQLVPNLIGGDQDQELATELALLQSRSAIGAVVDSLRLDVQTRNPGRIPPAQLVDSLRLPNRFKPVKFALTAGADTGHGGAGGVIWVSKSGAGAAVRLVDREDAITDVADHLSVTKSGGDAVEVVYSGRDSITAAQVPNLLAQVYMARRKTVDRGLNQRRLEFLSARADTVRHDLRRAVDSLAELQQASGAGVSVQISAKALADELAAVESQLAQLRASQHALDTLIAAVAAHRMDPRALAGFPDLLRSPAINDLVTSIAQVETQRTILLGRVAESAPQVVALAHARDSLAAQLVPLAGAYRQSLARQRASLQLDADSLEMQLDRLPGREASVAKQQADLTQLSEIDAGMGAQVLQARLAAMLEGGDVRVVDPAEEPRRVSFPRPMATWLIGLFGGLVLGLILVPVGAAGKD